MNILILGASGFIGNAVLNALVSEHHVSIAGRSRIDGYVNWHHLDFSTVSEPDRQPEYWDELLHNIDLVINSIGIIEGDFDQIQTKGPIALFKACITRNIKILNISAVGAEKDNPPTQFLQSKKNTDTLVLSYDLGKVIYPGIVLGANGQSSQFFAAISRLPIIPLIKNDSPFVHISQLTGLVLQIVNDFNSFDQQIFATSKKEPFKDILKAMNGGKGVFIPFPTTPFKILFSLFPSASIGIFNRDTLKLQSLIQADDYEPRFKKASFNIEPEHVIESDAFVVAFALFALSFIWIWSGVSSLVSWDTSYKLMQEIGADDQVSKVFIYLGSGVDILLGLAIFSKKLRHKVLLFQLLFLATYMIILSVLAPHYWLHPLGVLSKNIPLLALTYYLLHKESSASR